jgi:hypothetical protein
MRRYQQSIHDRTDTEQIQTQTQSFREHHLPRNIIFPGTSSSQEHHLPRNIIFPEHHRQIHILNTWIQTSNISTDARPPTRIHRQNCTFDWHLFQYHHVSATVTAMTTMAPAITTPAVCVCMSVHASIYTYLREFPCASPPSYQNFCDIRLCARQKVQQGC